MKKRNRTDFILPAGLLLLFLLYTAAVMLVDVRPIGPQHSSVGFAAVNGWLHRLVGVHLGLYRLTDWLGLVSLLPMLGFAGLGLAQLVKRKSLLRVDGDILALGGFYLLVLFAYLFFECAAVNYRPVLIDGVLEASYPSSTTMLVLCVMPTAMLQFRRRIGNRALRDGVNALCGAFTAFMVAGRLLSGVHWLTDIVGGVLLSAALVALYRAAERRAAPLPPR